MRAVAGETVEHVDKIVLNPHTGRDVHFRVHAVPLRDVDGRIAGAVEVARDVTLLVELETLKDDFIDVAAHELRTPVAVIKGYAAQLRRTLPDLGPTHRHMLDAIDRGSVRLTRIAQDLVDLARLHLGWTSVSLERVALAEVVEQVVTCTMAAGCRHRLRVVHLDEVDVRGDGLRIGQVLERLLDNARRFSPDGTDVEIALVAREADGLVTVADHGIGIPRDQQERVFERFYRAHAGTAHDVGGMGVGLYISRQLVRQMGGDLQFVSEEGKGSRFSATFPRWTAPS